MLNIRAALAVSHYALPAGDMSVYVYVRVPQVAHFQWLDQPFPLLVPSSAESKLYQT